MASSELGGAGALTPSGSASGPPAGQRGDNLGDILERVLDKGIVIAGDIQVNLLDIELLTIRLRLIVASVDTARRMGINWWEADPRLAAGSDDDRRSLAKPGAEPLARNLEDLALLERTARAHQAVLDRGLAAGAVVPLRLCTISADDAQLRRALERNRAIFLEALERVRGRAE